VVISVPALQNIYTAMFDAVRESVTSSKEFS